MITQELLRTLHVSKTMNGQEILRDMNFYINRKERITIIGLHDAGKSMFLDIITSREKQYGGSVFYEGKLLEKGTCSGEQNGGIFIMNNHPQLAGNLTVAQNLYFYDKSNEKKIVTSQKKKRAFASVILDVYDVNINPDALVEDLSPVELNLLNLICIAIQKPKLIILCDIPFAEDASRDNRLSMILNKINDKGTAILFVENKISRVAMMGDYVYLMRSGMLSNRIAVDTIDQDYAFQLLVGTKRAEKSVLQENLKPDKRIELFSVSEGGKEVFILHESEIIGLVIEDMPYNEPDYFTSYLIGNKRVAIKKKGEPVRFRSVQHMLKNGVAVIPDLVARNHLSFEDNITLPLETEITGPFGLINRRKQKYISEQIREKMKLEYDELEKAFCKNRGSGITMKKMQIGQLLWKYSDVYIFMNPFQSLDEQGCEDIQKIIRNLADRGAGILLVSSNYYKLYTACDMVLER